MARLYFHLHLHGFPFSRKMVCDSMYKNEIRSDGAVCQHCIKYSLQEDLLGRIIRMEKMITVINNKEN